MLRILSVAALLAFAEGAGKCVNFDGTDWTVVSIPETTEACVQDTADDAATCDASGFTTGTAVRDAAAASCGAGCTHTPYVAPVKMAAADCNEDTEQFIGGFDQESAIGSSPRRKTWWTKRLIADNQRIHFGGQPTARDLKMLYEQGFSAVYSLWPFPTSG